MAIKTITKPAGAKNTPAKIATAPAAVKVTPAKSVASSNGVKKAPAKATPAKTAAVKKTVIVAKVNVGWGNSVYLRGEGDGLSWDVGVLMECGKKDEWEWSCPASAGPVTFKFVRNDLHWEIGENHVAAAGSTGIFTPQFPPWTA